MTRIGMIFMAISGCALLTHGTAFAHAGNLDQAPWHACEGLTLSATCSFESAQHDAHRGTCRAVAGTLLCVRNRPIERSAQQPNATSRGVSAGRAGAGTASTGLVTLLVLALLNVPLALKRFTRRRST